jgi:hypothetical protein
MDEARDAGAARGALSLAPGGACPSPKTTWGRDGGRFAPATSALHRGLSYEQIQSDERSLTTAARGDYWRPGVGAGAGAVGSRTQLSMPGVR